MLREQRETQLTWPVEGELKKGVWKDEQESSKWEGRERAPPVGDAACSQERACFEVLRVTGGLGGGGVPAGANMKGSVESP